MKEQVDEKQREHKENTKRTQIKLATCNKNEWQDAKNNAELQPKCGPGSSVGIATGYGLDGPGIESRGGARFFAPIQTSPRAHQASCTTGTGSFQGVKSGRGVTLNPSPPSSAMVKKE